METGAARSEARLGSQRVYSGRVISVDLDRVRFPNGTEGELEMVRHSGASAVVPFTGSANESDPEVLLLKQYRYAAETYLYEVPAGRLDPGEKPLDCALRELREETGCTAESVKFLTTIYTTPGFTDERIHIFQAERLVRGASEREADEFIELVTMPLSAALRMIEQGEVQDAKTIVALLVADRLRRGSGR